MAQVVTARFPESVVEALDREAAARRRSRADILREAVDLYLEEWADYQTALDRLQDPTDRTLTWEELLSDLTSAQATGDGEG